MNKIINFWIDFCIIGMVGGVFVKDKVGKVVGVMGISGMVEFDDEVLV